MPINNHDCLPQITIIRIPPYSPETATHNTPLSLPISAIHTTLPVSNQTTSPPPFDRLRHRRTSATTRTTPRRRLYSPRFSPLVHPFSLSVCLCFLLPPRCVVEPPHHSRALCRIHHCRTRASRHCCWSSTTPCPAFLSSSPCSVSRRYVQCLFMF